MTYQYLMVDMLRKAWIHRPEQTAGKYGFDSVILTNANMKVLNGYISYIRPLPKPQCDFVLVHRNGGQHGKLGEITSKVVFDAIGKYIHAIAKLLKRSEERDFVRGPKTQLCCC